MFWYRWIQTEATRVGPSTINSRQAFALSSDGEKIYLHLEDTKHFCRDIDAIRLLQNSRPIAGKDTIKDATIQDIKDRAGEKKENSVPVLSPQNAPGSPIKMFTGTITIRNTTPRIPKSFPIKIRMLDAPEVLRIRNRACQVSPIGSDLAEVVSLALHYLGNKTAPTSRKFMLCESDSLSTCFMAAHSGDGTLNSTIVLDRFQLAAINAGVLDTAFIARVITHEYAHYLWHSGAIKQTHKEKFRQALAGRRLHPNQFEHAGYNYPWYEEAWAILAEYMVHGKSARRLSVTDGWEIVAEYFDNNFLKAGTPSGEAVDTRYI